MNEYSVLLHMSLPFATLKTRVTPIPHGDLTPPKDQKNREKVMNEMNPLHFPSLIDFGLKALAFRRA